MIHQSRNFSKFQLDSKSEVGLEIPLFSPEFSMTFFKYVHYLPRDSDFSMLDMASKCNFFRSKKRLFSIKQQLDVIWVGEIVTFTPVPDSVAVGTLVLKQSKFIIIFSLGKIT